MKEIYHCKECHQTTKTCEHLHNELAGLKAHEEFLEKLKGFLAEKLFWLGRNDLTDFGEGRQSAYKDVKQQIEQFQAEQEQPTESTSVINIRELTYDYMVLPYPRKIKIAESLELLPDNYRNLNFHELDKQVLANANNKHLLPKLAKLIEEQKVGK